MTLHPFFAALLEKNAGTARLSSGSPQDARDLVAQGRAALGAGPEMAKVHDVAVPTRWGNVSARLLVPTGEVGGLVVYLHGGGWVVGSIDDFETLGRTLAERSACAVLMPDYRLAPEHPFPAGLEDAEDVILWGAQNVASLLGSPVPLVVAGDSAGANLATVACRRLADRVDVALEVLIYPVTDSDFESTSYLSVGDTVPLTREDMRWFFAHYAPKDLWEHEDVAPARASGLGALPPTLVVTAEHDVLRSEGQLYAERLTRAGVHADYASYGGMVHGFLRLHHHVDVADRALDDVAAAIARAVRATEPSPIPTTPRSA